MPEAQSRRECRRPNPAEFCSAQSFFYAWAICLRAGMPAAKSRREWQSLNPKGNAGGPIPKRMPPAQSRRLLITIKNFLYLHNNHDSIQINGSTMDKLEYISPVLDVVNIVSEAGFASSANPVDFQDGGWL